MAKRKSNKQVKAMIEGVNRHNLGHEYCNGSPRWLAQSLPVRIVTIWRLGFYWYVPCR